VGLRVVFFSSEQRKKSEALMNGITLNILNILNYFNKPQFTAVFVPPQGLRMR
jgi:hypothetical protein